MFDVMSKAGLLSQKDIHSLIHDSFRQLLDILKIKGIPYNNLGSVLNPNKTKKELALVFDTSLIEDVMYGRYIFDLVMPLLNKKSSHCVFIGDLTLGDNSKENISILIEFLREEFFLVNSTQFSHPTQYYIFYITNLTENMCSNFVDTLKNNPCFSGFVDCTYSSNLKEVFSFCIGMRFIKYKDTVILGGDTEEQTNQNTNNLPYDFKKHNLKYRSIQYDLFLLFLCYKISRPVYQEYSMDTLVGGFSIDPAYQDLYGLPVVVEEKKYNEYLVTDKTGVIKKMGVASKSDLENVLQKILRQSYLFNFRFERDEYKLSGFSLCLEIFSVDTGDLAKYEVAFNYEKEKGQLRLITIY